MDGEWGKRQVNHQTQNPRTSEQNREIAASDVLDVIADGSGRRLEIFIMKRMRS